MTQVTKIAVDGHIVTNDNIHYADCHMTVLAVRSFYFHFVRDCLYKQSVFIQKEKIIPLSPLHHIWLIAANLTLSFDKQTARTVNL